MMADRALWEYDGYTETPWSLAAAAEIERLREEVNRWRLVAERFAESHPQFDAFHSYFKEVRNG